MRLPRTTASTPPRGVCLVLVILATPIAGWSAGETEFLEALKEKDLATLESLVDAGSDPNLSTDDGKTALMIVASEGRTALAEKLIASGSRVDLPNHNGGTALMYAAVRGKAEMVAMLLSHGADVNAQGRNGWTALTLAAVKGYDPVVRILLTAGADANLPDIYGGTPLIRAVSERRKSTVEVLLDAPGIDLDRADDSGATALHHAAASGDAAMVRWLIERGADPRTTDGSGRTPAVVAARLGYPELSQLMGGVESSEAE